MRSENEIRMYYIDTLHKADQLEELAEQLSRIANHTLQEIQDEMTGNWKGAGSGQYLKKHMKMADLAKKHAKLIWLGKRSRILLFDAEEGITDGFKISDSTSIQDRTAAGGKTGRTCRKPIAYCEKRHWRNYVGIAGMLDRRECPGISC